MSKSVWSVSDATQTSEDSSGEIHTGKSQFNAILTLVFIKKTTPVIETLSSKHSAVMRL